MVIGNIDFPIYATFLLLSLIFSILFNYIYLKKNQVSREYLLLSIFMNIAFCIIGAKTMTIFTHWDKNLTLLSAGFSSYGGAIGILVSSYVFSKMVHHNIILKSNILSLPLMYSVSKLGCFFAGCCYGIPYHGILNVIYSQKLNIPLFPVQLVESILFLFIFILGYLYRKKKYISEIVILLSTTTKFLLEYFRYENIGKIICINQVVSLIIIIITILFLMKRKRVEQNV